LSRKPTTRQVHLSPVPGSIFYADFPGVPPLRVVTPRLATVAAFAANDRFAVLEHWTPN